MVGGGNKRWTCVRLAGFHLGEDLERGSGSGRGEVTRVNACAVGWISPVRRCGWEAVIGSSGRKKQEADLCAVLFGSVKCQVDVHGAGSL